MDKKAARETARQYLVLTLSGVVYSWAFDAFYAPNAFTYGGFTGISQIINFYIPFLPVGMMIMVMNVPLYVVGFRKFGFAFLFRSLYEMVLTSVLIDFFAMIHTFPPGPPLIYAVCGVFVIGTTTGLMYREETTAGGTELAAWIIREKAKGLSLGRICLVVDMVVIVAYAVVFGNLMNAVYGGIALVISTTMMDVVVAVGKGRKGVSEPKKP